jgi:1,4-dihydroxy-2-naphthoate octaprenyltransferase
MFRPADNQQKMEKRVEKQRMENEEHKRYLAIGLAIYMPSFAAIGIALCATTDNPGFLGLGLAIGVALGIAIGEGLYRRSREHEGKEQ